ncbi:hypothetical protein O7632_22665 [Solwaraspora sp. WMMD406]|uniref:hypothetical protein n=1 Tax=Solwaraspora sp. WMMD406 TaxID=3016095 RepID=UPI002417A4B5|nr:hypothetical protein [Solwaraspora sp. WMMD406]MDG4766879.1 hypothetical protein [Solwaraspora sp. WMMD406]
MRRLMTPVLVLALLTTAGGCAAEADGTAPDLGGTVADAEDGSTDGGESTDGVVGTTVPPCSFTVEQVTDLVGQPMVDDGNCLFGDGNGVAALTITMASGGAGAATYDYQLEQAEAQYDQVIEVEGGYLAVKDIRAEAVVVSDAGSYTLTMSSFDRFGGTAYEPVLRGLLDALPR